MKAPRHSAATSSIAATAIAFAFIATPPFTFNSRAADPPATSPASRPTTAPVAEIISWPENPSISPDYIVGADLSWVQLREANGIHYSDNGTTKDILEILKSHGFNYVRLRLFVDPTKPVPTGRPYSAAGFCDLPHTIAMAKRINAAGMKFLLDFHYSDSWADPGKQFTPSSWKDLPFPDLVTKLHDYTQDALQQLKDAGAQPDMVQVGNEITPGLLTDGPNGGGSTKNWNQLSQLLNAGLSAVKQVDPKIRTMLHIDRGGDNRTARTWVDNALSHNVHFDVLGLSCYQRWQGPPSGWKANFTDLANRYPNLKFVMAEVDAQATNANAIMTSLPNQQGLGTFIWEPTANNANQALFDNRGNVIETKMSAYDEVTKKLNLKQ